MKTKTTKKKTRSEQTTELELATLRHVKLYGFSTYDVIGRLLFHAKKDPADSARHLVSQLNRRLPRRSYGYATTFELPYHEGEKGIRLTKPGSDKCGGSPGKTKPSQFRYRSLVSMYGCLLFCCSEIRTDSSGRRRETRPKLSWPQFRKHFSEHHLDDPSYAHALHAVENVEPDKHAGSSVRINLLTVVGNANEQKLLLKVFREHFLDRFSHPAYAHLMANDAFCFRFICASDSKRDAIFRAAEGAKATLQRSCEPADDPDLFQEEFLRRIKFSVQTLLEKLL